MPKLRSLSGEDLQRIFALFGFSKLSQRGSHLNLRRLTAEGSRQTLTIVIHRELDRGTLRAIFRQALRYIPETGFLNISSPNSQPPRTNSKKAFAAWLKLRFAGHTR